MSDKTYWDCAKPALSETFALAEGDGSVAWDGRVERDVAGWFTILSMPVAESSESCLLAPDSSVGIEAWM